MPLLRALALSASLSCAWPGPAGAGQISLTIRDGRVTLSARDVTVRQILAEWARVGKTSIVNLERVPGGPVSLELKDVPEARALEIILRPIAGFMAAPRTDPTPDTSYFGRIVVMPALAAAVPATAPTSALRPEPARRPLPLRPDNPFLRNRGEPDAVLQDSGEDPDDAGGSEDDEPAMPPRPRLGMRPPGTVPGQQGGTQDDTAAGGAGGRGVGWQPGQPVQPGQATGTPLGAPVPGVTVGTPALPSRPGQAPPQLPKPPGEPR